MGYILPTLIAARKKENNVAKCMGCGQDLVVVKGGVKPCYLEKTKQILNFYILGQELTNIFCKETAVHIFGFVDQKVSWTLPLQHERGSQYVNNDAVVFQ